MVKLIDIRNQYLANCKLDYQYQEWSFDKRWLVFFLHDFMVFFSTETFGNKLWYFAHVSRWIICSRGSAWFIKKPSVTSRLHLRTVYGIFRLNPLWSSELVLLMEIITWWPVLGCNLSLIWLRSLPSVEQLILSPTVLLLMLLFHLLKLIF